MNVENQVYFETYEAVKRFRPARLRVLLRNVALAGLSLIDRVRGNEEALRRNRIQFLYIHHVFKDEEERLDALLNRLSKDHYFISYSESVEKILRREIDKPYICISSDDGFKHNIRAAEILSWYGAKACFFINPSVIGEARFDRVSTFCWKKLHFPPVEFLTWNDVEKLIEMGHEVGSHTMEHMDLGEASVEAIQADMQSCHAILMSRCGMAKHFAFPYGRFGNFSDAARNAVFNAGFTSCATAERGCHINHNVEISRNELCILRDHVILNWDINHILYFISSNARRASVDSNYFPYR